MTSYRVGQVLYIIPAKEARIYSVQIVEEVTKKTLEGTVTTHMVRGNPSAGETLSIDQIDGEVFDSAGKIQKALLERATASITSMVDDAVAKAHEWFPEGFEQASDDELASLKRTPQQGDPARPAATKPANKRPQPQRQAPELVELAAELRADNEKLEVEMPDGSRVRVNSIKVPDTLQS